MSVFDLRTALYALGSGNSPVDALAISYGAPTCLLSLTKEVLQALPTPILRGITKTLIAGNETAREAVAALKRKILLENGIIEIDAENGTFKFISAASRAKINDDSNNDSNNLLGFVNAVAGAVQAGAEIYTNYQNVTTLLTGVKDCIDSYRAFLNLQQGQSSLLADPTDLESRYALEIAQARDAEDFINQSSSVLSDITSVIVDRISDPSKEPRFNSDFLPSGTQFQTEQSETKDAPIFRLVFGPPKSKKGQFLFSVDGLYYDSQGKELPQVSGVIPNEELYKFNYNPNLGGKGESLSTKDLVQYVNTIFDLAVIDDSLEMQRHYDADHFLRVLYGQKASHLFTLSSTINSLLTAGYSEDSAMVVNSYQQLLAVDAQHNLKINKRKKQIEVAIKAPLILGASRQFNPGEVPINDFSFLSKVNLAVELDKQKKLTFRQGEVSGVVLPIVPKYVKAAESQASPYFEHLVVPPVGIGSLMFNSSSTDNFNLLSLTDSIVTDGLIAIYNFLEPEVTYPGSDEYNLLNCASKTNRDKAAQLVGESTSSIFVSGLAIPFLTGMVSRNNSTGAVSGNGSYVQLPNIQSYQNLLYSQNGCTISFWTHIPELYTSSTDYFVERGWSVSSLHKVLFACENTGGGNYNESASSLQINYGTDFVRGLVCGFTRDRQLVSDLEPSNTSSLNPVDSSSIYFYLAPTRSYNSSNIGFLRDTVTVDCASPIYRYLKLAVPAHQTFNNKTLSSVSSEFCEITLTFSPIENNVKLYFDGTLVVTSALNQVFGSDGFKAPRIPSFVLSNSYSYSTSIHPDFEYGPTVSSFTPWVLGSGYSDGLVSGFMGEYNGFNSGLGGFIGGVKFYSRPLKASEVLYNYENQQGFFKNIEV